MSEQFILIRSERDEQINAELFLLEEASRAMELRLDSDSQTPIVLSDEQKYMVNTIKERPLIHARTVGGLDEKLTIGRVKLLDQLLKYPQLFDADLAAKLGMHSTRPEGTWAGDHYGFIRKWNPQFTTPEGSVAAVCAANILKDLHFSGNELSWKAKSMGENSNIVVPILQPLVAPVPKATTVELSPMAEQLKPVPITAKIGSTVLRGESGQPEAPTAEPEVVVPKRVLTTEQRKHLNELWKSHVPLSKRTPHMLKGEVSDQTKIEQLREFNEKVQRAAETLRHRCKEKGVSPDNLSGVAKGDAVMRLALHLVRNENLESALV